MGYDLEYVEPLSRVYLDQVGVQSLDEGMELIERLAALLRRHDPRECIVDLSQAPQTNGGDDVLIYAEALARKAFLMQNLRMTVIHPVHFGVTVVPARFLEREGVHLEEFRLTDQVLNFTRKPKSLKREG